MDSAVPQQLVDRPQYFDLLGLPRELRDEIYSFILTAPTPLIYRNRKKNRKVVIEASIYSQTDILRANHQIHEEAEEVLFKKNTFLLLNPNEDKYARNRRITPFPQLKRQRA
jgi:hypothetical protein